MPPRLPIFPAVHRCADVSIASVVQRFSAVSLSTSAYRAAPPRKSPLASSGASFLDLDGEPARGPGSTAVPGRSRMAGSSSSNNSNNSNGYAPTSASGDMTSSNAALSRVLFDSGMRRRMNDRREEQSRSTLERMAERKVSEDYARQMPRRWRAGDVYAPHDLSAAEMAKWRRPSRTTADVVDILGINPLDEYRNFAMVSEFVSTMGRIKHSRETGLRAVNQRRMARAIRRAIGLGIHPSVHRHPEILTSEIANMPKQSYASYDSRQRR
ncbi:37S ribosomal protein [Grosmannia clavigera kw1407]|uniref:Small ribosomal subunit protein bS18m n=1 Tax=Grosmannia clavigera (strain kw1407 / UAMH 11150) TaxID=655863 RepID=F0XGL9_GROCL|nr:37S ribosomal protein [Grosmannia clavigera kw1407]EFX03098.1 37S ribosomal protein [Grosmannia clavigera kw1407]